MLRPAAAMLTLAHLCYIVAHAFHLPPGPRGVMLAVDGATALAGLVLFFYFSRGRISEKHANHWAAVMIALAMANFAYQIFLTPDPSLATFIVLLIVAAGCFLLSWGWMTAAILGSLAVWAWGIILNPGGDWWGVAHLFLIGLVLGLLVHGLRFRSYSQYERLQQQLERTAGRLEQRLRFERILTQISTHLLALGVEEIQNVVGEAMQSLGEYLEIDHVCVCQLEGTPPALWMISEWCAPAALSRKERMQNVPMTRLPWCWQQLQADENVSIARVSDLPTDAEADRTFLEEHGVRSFFAVPLTTEGRLSGLLGLAKERQEVDWSDETACLIRVLGEIIVTSLKRKAAEEEICSLNRRLEHASRLVGLGEMAGNLTHDLGNGLSSILQFTQGAALRSARGTLTLDLCYECVEDIREQAGYMRTIVKMMQQFLRTRTTERVAIHLPQLIEQSSLLVRGKVRQHNIQLDIVNPPQLPLFVVDPTQITIVIVNLLLNAAQAMGKTEPENRRITITLLNDRPDFVEVSVRDYGPGVAPELAEKIFERFFTTKKDGLGLGLAFSRSYIEQHGGKLWCNPQTHPGCEFRFTLPISPPETISKPVSAP